MTDPGPQDCLGPAELVDSDHPAVRGSAARHARGANDHERAVALYYAVREGFRYDPYRIDLAPAGMRASSVLALGYGPSTRPATSTWSVCGSAAASPTCRSGASSADFRATYPAWLQDGASSMALSRSDFQAEIADEMPRA